MPTAKTVAQAIGTVLVAVLPLLVVGSLGFSEWVNVIVVGVGAFLVWNTKNYPNWRYGKALASGAATLTAGLVVLASNYAFGDVSSQQWLQLVVSVITTVSVYLIPNTGYRYHEVQAGGPAPRVV